MTTTSQSGAKGADGTSPPAQEPKAPTDDKSVPLGEHIELRQSYRKLADQMKELQAQIDASKNTPPKPPPATDAPDVHATLQELQRRDRLRELREEHGLSRKQGEAINGLMEKYPGMTPNQAKAVARTEHADLFGEDDLSPGARTGRPQTALPEPEKPQEDPFEKHMKAMAALPPGRVSDAAFNNTIGHILCEDLGIEGHRLNDLQPKR